MKLKPLFLVCLAICLGTAGCGLGQTAEGCPGGLFSWDIDVLTDRDRDQLFSVMDRERLQELYQHIPGETEFDTVRAFLEEAKAHEIEVYYLTGDPSWGLDENGTRLREEIRKVESMNRQLEKSTAFRGIMADVEPYLTEGWEEKPVEIMKQYVASMKAAWKEADQAGLKLIACIPYSYDTEGFTEELEQLIHEGCHGIAIMNYYKGKEWAHLKTEFELAEKYGKSIMNIYELQQPGIYGLEEKNTYYKEGMPGIRKSYKELIKEAGTGRIGLGIHNYKALLEVAEN